MDLLDTDCYICYKTYKAKKNLYQHLRRVHQVLPYPETTIKCPKIDCNYTCNFLGILRAHVEEVHGTIVKNEQLRFQNWEEFIKWKEKTELETSSSFVQRNGVKRRGEKFKHYFTCHRSGIFATTEKDERQIKSQGSCKMGSHCTAGIEAEKSLCGVIVSFYKTHFGHSINTDQSSREAIAGKVAEGVELQRNLDDARNTASKDVTRLNLLTLRDLHNIKRDFNLQNEEMKQTDEISVELWVKKMKGSVLLFKKQGDEDINNQLEVNDFLLILMTDSQQELFPHLAKNIICVDTKHVPSQNFFLTTLLVVDEYGSGLPLAFCITNKENTKIMEIFFNSIKEKCGVVTPLSFMSNECNTFINAWSAVMGKPQNHILCTWHVNRNWHINLAKVKGKTEKKNLIYKRLCTLLEETHIEKFNELLQEFLNLINDDNSRDFASYFLQNYASRPEVWAYCYRSKVGDNINLHLAAMHSVLKYYYLEVEKNNRLDKLLNILLKFVRDKCFERLLKVYKGKQTYKLTKIQERHERSYGIHQDNILQIEDGKVYEVESETQRNIVYTVKHVSKICKEQCKLICSDCRICFHTWTCTCPDHMVHMNICKHIHAVVSTIQDDIHYEEKVHEVQVNVTDHCTTTCSIINKDSDAGSNKATNIDNVEIKLQTLTCHIKSKKLSENTLQTISARLDDLLALCNEKSECQPGCQSGEGTT